jgi:cysteine desulfuration protein SufE
MTPGSPQTNEQAIVTDFLPVRDPHERLALITDACAGPGIPDHARMEADLVPGCVSRVWLRRLQDNHALVLEWDAESPLVRGLAGLICRIFQQTDPAQAQHYQSSILITLGLDRQLSPTRLRGLTAMEQRIRDLAR